jgi:hypothetical protein
MAFSPGTRRLGRRRGRIKLRLAALLGEVYAGLVSASLASARTLPRSEIGRELGVSSLAAGPGVLAALVLLITAWMLAAGRTAAGA